MRQHRPEPPDNMVFGHKIAPYANADTWEKQVGSVIDAAIPGETTRPAPLTVDAIANAVRVVVRHEIRAALAELKEEK